MHLSYSEFSFKVPSIFGSGIFDILFPRFCCYREKRSPGNVGVTKNHPLNVLMKIWLLNALARPVEIARTSEKARVPLKHPNR